MKRFLSTLFLMLCFAGKASAAQFTFVNESVADMHADTDERGEIVSQAIYGTPVRQIESKNGWTMIETPDNYRGWCKDCQLISQDRPYPATPIVARVNSLWAHVYFVEDTTPHPPRLSLPYGTKVEVLSSQDELQNRWMKVRLIDGSAFFAQCTDFVFNPSPMSLDEMLSEAKRFIGLPYRWGGTSSFGFDCSGFVQTLFSLMNVQLPRDAKLQAKAEIVAPVAEDDLRKGDLIFFGRVKERVTHVGIYLGEGNFIHSVTTNKTGPHAIQISALDDPEWKSIYISAGRVMH